MYQNWKIKKWDTPFSKSKSLRMVSLIDDINLRITVEDINDGGRFRWQISFKKYSFYRNIPEEYRLELWEHLDKSQQRCGTTFEVVGSPLIKELAEKEPLFKGELHHYVIATEDDVIEILSVEDPKIENIGKVPDNVRISGKSIVYFNSKDRRKMKNLISKFKSKK